MCGINNVLININKPSNIKKEHRALMINNLFKRAYV